MRYRKRSSPRPACLRRLALAATTMACDCSPSSRSPNGSSWLRKTSAPVHSSRQSVAPVSTKKSRLTIMPFSYLDVRELADNQNPDNLRDDGVGEKLDAHRVRP